MAQPGQPQPKMISKEELAERSILARLAKSSQDGLMSGSCGEDGNPNGSNPLIQNRTHVDPMSFAYGNRRPNQNMQYADGGNNTNMSPEMYGRPQQNQQYPQQNHPQQNHPQQNYQNNQPSPISEGVAPMIPMPVPGGQTPQSTARTVIPPEIQSQGTMGKVNVPQGAVMEQLIDNIEELTEMVQSMGKMIKTLNNRSLKDSKIIKSLSQGIKSDVDNDDDDDDDDDEMEAKKTTQKRPGLPGDIVDAKEKFADLGSMDGFDMP